MKSSTERIESEQDLSTAIGRIGRHAREALQSEPIEISVKKAGSRRSIEQNRMMWAALRDVADQVRWAVDGKETLLSPDDWKQIVTAGLKREQRIAAGIDGGFVVLGQHTSRMTVREMGELIELIHAFGSQHGVAWSDPDFVSQVEALNANR